MRKTVPTYSDRQLQVVTALQRNRMAGVMFYFILTVFALLLGLSIYIAFFSRHPWVAWIPGSLDSIIGWSLRAIVVFLFPPPSQQASDALSQDIVSKKY